MRRYKCLLNSIFDEKEFSLIPIRDEDKYVIMKMRNEQMYHLRQNKPLTIEDQKYYFENTISKMFVEEKPDQLLFSFLKNNEFIGYGGLVHINWNDMNAEISFIMRTELENENFKYFWLNYLSILNKIAFTALDLHKIYTYAFDLRPNLYSILIEAGFKEESRLKEHCFFNGNFLDVVIHSKWNRELKYRKATINDLRQYFDWTNDSAVRKNSFYSEKITLEEHTKWFKNKIADDNCLMLVFENHCNEIVGQVRIEKKDMDQAIIGISNDHMHRGKGYASQMLIIASELFHQNEPSININAYIKIENKASELVFQKAGYILNCVTDCQGYKSYHYVKHS